MKSIWVKSICTKSIWLGALLAASLLPAVAQDRYVPHTARGQAASAIVRQWSGHVHKVYGVAPMQWARAMRESFAQADLANLKKAAGMRTYEGMMGTLLGQRTSDALAIDGLARSQGTRAEVMAVGNPARDLVYTMVTPCRIVDTRNAGGRMGAGETRSFSSSGASFVAQGGADSDCAMPADASAVVLNAVAVTPDTDGYMTVYPYGFNRPNAASLNYHAGRVAANEIIAGQSLGQPQDFSVYTYAAADLVIDVVGYFMAPRTTALDCVQVRSDPVSIPRNIVPYIEFSTPNCPVGYSLTGGGCRAVDPQAARGLYFLSFGKSPASFTDSYQCHAQHVNDTGTEPSQAVAEGICCRVPGR
ncbi:MULTISPECIES: hypothetical protein [unclassified Lysobacter]|uniref:hypothetical protein n=1 Tax=unclassified Lysobacter TaxID=2635362 RepID=UPI0006FD3A12|nr:MULTISPECIES: hypothetical protein [unclassified Lysobacter]KQZ66148.1 hypothetical protein ASD53_17110 [Lysobacter sp. Root559]KRC32176.1 hypothetical protein ASE10_16655 [Lysobacter sp. Root76]KRD67638.1 hypothetical protein ASE45_12830 [Lysobacter sp. Root96]